MIRSTIRYIIHVPYLRSWRQIYQNTKGINRTGASKFVAQYYILDQLRYARFVLQSTVYDILLYLIVRGI